MSVLTAPAKAGLLAMPRPVDSDAMVFRGKKGGTLTGPNPALLLASGSLPAG